MIDCQMNSFISGIRNWLMDTTILKDRVETREI